MKRYGRWLIFCGLTGAMLAAALICYAKYGTGHGNHPHVSSILLPDGYTREAWLNLYGWEVTAVSEEKTQMPAVYQTDVGQAWLTLQAKQGLSPESFGGEAAVRYTYHVENLHAETFYAELLLCGDQLVGAMVYDMESGAMERVK